MPKIQIDVPQPTYDKLKQEAKDHYQSLRAYITYHLVQYINNPDKFIDTTTLPEGTTIRTTTAHQLTPEEEEQARLDAFQKLAKQIVGHTLTVEDYRIMDYNSDNYYYERDLAVPLNEGSSIYCMYIYDLPVDRQKQYLEEFKQYEQK